MDAEQAKLLRKPFPASAIGQLPKAGMMLDYVGHAATTDRLLEVDPGWTWEPYALDDHGLPALDKQGNLWIKLTVCGVTRPGVGDGKTAKELIGDAIRNAAMRFGVALDLWAKEDLQANGDAPAVSVMERQKQRIQARAEPATKSTASEEDDGKPTDKMNKKMDVMVTKLREAGIINTEKIWSVIAAARGEDVIAMEDRVGGRDEFGDLHWAPLRMSLTRAEASRLIDWLERHEQASS
jgi:hypothetical protein